MEKPAKNLHQDREHVLGAHEPAVKERQARDGHENDEDGRDQHPGRVALVRNGCCRRCGRGRFLGEDGHCPQCTESKSAQEGGSRQGSKIGWDFH